jgi:Rad3-related DNA helicase
VEILFDERIVRLGVGELAQFRLGPRDAGALRAGRWRMEAGSAWHRRLQQDEQARADTTGGEAPRFEVVVSGAVLFEGWRIELQGRMDQVLVEGGRTILREVKTVSHPLPLPEDRLREMYPGYFAQAGAYQVLCGLNPALGLTGAVAQLFFVDIDEGTRQTVMAGEGARGSFDAQIRLLWDFIESRRSSRHRILSAEIAPPFDAVRSGQGGTEEQLHSASLQSRIVLFEAPTGFGKTAYALHHALTRMKSGLAERVIYLTGKSTGQIQVVRELERRWDGVVRAQQMRSKAEHAIQSLMHTCGEGSCREGIEEQWRRSALNPAALAAAGPLPLEDARALGARTGVCPFEITRSVLPFSDLWIGDYNYVFHPRACSVFMEQPGFDPARALLIIDEAHNLPARVADAWSAKLDARRLEDLSVELTFAHPPRRIGRALESLHRFVERLPKSERHVDTVRYEALDLLREYVDALQGEALDADSLRPGAFEALWELADALGPLENDALELLLWSPARGLLNITCIDASREVAARLRQFGGVLLMSATLRPVEHYVSACGLDAKDVFFLRGVAPWRGMGYEVAADVRPDTRLKSRARHLRLTAETIADLHAAPGRIGPVVAVFPSYRYAADVANAIECGEAFLRVATQPRGLDLEGQRAFVEDSLGGMDVLMLVLGSGFTEGIDALGGRVSHAIVVSPALPEADAVQKARMETAPGPNSRAFHDVYMVPGIRKVCQALGRLVRAPGQSAKVLLHCNRYAESDYIALLDEDFRPQDTIRTREELLAWLGGE